jgi:hypothetical protein
VEAQLRNWLVAGYETELNGRLVLTVSLLLFLSKESLAAKGKRTHYALTNKPTNAHTCMHIHVEN